MLSEDDPTEHESDDLGSRAETGDLVVTRRLEATPKTEDLPGNMYGKQGLVAPPLPHFENEEGPTENLPRLLPADQAITQPDMELIQSESEEERIALLAERREMLRAAVETQKERRLEQERNARSSSVHEAKTELITAPRELRRRDIPPPTDTLLDFKLPGSLAASGQAPDPLPTVTCIDPPRPDPSEINARKDRRRLEAKNPPVKPKDKKIAESNIVVVERSLDEVLLSYLDDQE